MNLESLLNINNLEIAEVIDDQLIHLCSKENYWITNFDPSTMKPNEYAATQCLYLCVEPQYDTYKTITEKQHNKYVKASEKYVEQRKKHIEEPDDNQIIMSLIEDETTI